MKTTLIKAILIVLVVAGLIPTGIVQAERGAPGSADFGYGAWLHPQGSNLDQALGVISDLHLDWVALDLDWSALMPSANSTPDLANLDRSIAACAQSGAAVMFSLYDPPTWVMTAAGPDANLTAQFIQNLAARYGAAIQAIELYPGANLRSGWGTSPNPIAYATLFKTVKEKVTAAGFSFLWIAGGLQSGLSGQTEVGWSDEDFLRVLYAAGAKDWMDVLSLQFSATSGDPLRSPGAGDASALRHYEEIRQVMVENGQQDALIWITLVNPPDGTINTADQVYLDSQKQAEWLQQALVQTRSQLYVGVTFIANINAPAGETNRFSRQALIQPGQSYHPFYTVLKAIIQQTKPESGSTPPGRPKTDTLLKWQKKT